MKDWTLEAAAAEWLRYEHRCPVVMTERSPWDSLAAGRPDVCGVRHTSKKLVVIEIEVKRTVADYAANQEKRCMQLRQRWQDCVPFQFYFMLAPEIARKIVPPVWAGVLTVDPAARRSPNGLPPIVVIKPAPRHPHASPVPKTAIARLLRHQSGSLCKALALLAAQSRQAVVLA